MVRKSMLLLAVALVSAMPLLAADGARVEGKVIAAGKPLKLTHAYAISGGPGREGTVRVFFSDLPIADKDLSVFPDFKAVNEGKLHGMGVLLESDRSVRWVEIYDVSGTTTIEGQSKLELKTFSDTKIAGRIHLPKPYKDMNDDTYDFDLQFSVPVRPESDLNP